MNLFALMGLLLLSVSRSGSDKANENSRNSIGGSDESPLARDAETTSTEDVVGTSRQNSTEKSSEGVDKESSNPSVNNQTIEMMREKPENFTPILYSSESEANGTVVDEKSVNDSMANVTLSTTADSPEVVYFYSREGMRCVSNSDCNITNMERCQPVAKGINRCNCIAGHSRASNGKTCLAVKIYFVDVGVAQPSNLDLNQSSPAFREFLYNLREAAINSIRLSKLGPIFVDAQVKRLSTSPPGNIVVHYAVLLHRFYVPDIAVVKVDIKHGFSGRHLVTSLMNETLATSTVPTEPSATITGLLGDVDSLVVEDTNPCARRELNFCGDNALCLTSVRSFVCRCKKGFLDVSVDPVEAPGEECIPMCGCENGGECYTDENEMSSCKCPSWYLGETCSLDGRLLLMVIVGILGGLLLLAMIACICCVRFWKKRQKTKDEISSIYSLPREHIHAHKLPTGGRSWYDTWRYYSFSPPNYTSGASGGSLQQAKGSTAPHLHHRSHYPPVMAYRRSTDLSSQPIELVPQSYSNTYGGIPRPHVLPPPRPGTSSNHRANSHWLWSTTDSSYA